MADYRAVTMPTACVNITFGRAFSVWFQSISIRVKESTLANYQLKADKHILPVYRDYNITEINANFIYQFIKGKQDSELSNRYITDILVLMKSVFKYAARTSICADHSCRRTSCLIALIAVAFDSISFPPVSNELQLTP